jgi:hypothetical protein
MLVVYVRTSIPVPTLLIIYVRDIKYSSLRTSSVAVATAHLGRATYVSVSVMMTDVPAPDASGSRVE